MLKRLTKIHHAPQTHCKQSPAELLTEQQCFWLVSWKIMNTALRRIPHNNSDCIFTSLNKSLCCCRQTRAKRYLTPAVLYTDVDGQCDKLVTDDRHQCITLTKLTAPETMRVTTLPAAVPEIWLVLTKI